MRLFLKVFTATLSILAVVVTVQNPLTGQEVSRDQLLDYMQQLRTDHDLPGISVAVAVAP